MEILRDAIGVPHCYADDEAGAFHAQGWVHAADRLWQMEYDRRRAVGRLAEVVGRRSVRVTASVVTRDVAGNVAVSSRSLVMALPRKR